MKTNVYEPYLPVEFIDCLNASVTKRAAKLLISLNKDIKFYIGFRNNLFMNVIFLDHIISPTWSVVLFQGIVCTENVQDSLRYLPDCTKLFVVFSDHPYCNLTLDNHRQYVCDTRTIVTGIYIFWRKDSLTKYLRKYLY